MESHADRRLCRSLARRLYEISGDKPPYLLIEPAFIYLGSKSGNGGAFKKEALTLAGWNGGALTAYASRAQSAAEVFYWVREVLSGIA